MYAIILSIMSKIILFFVLFEISNMIHTQAKPEERFCNCKQSKCMKLYCECLSSRLPCGKSCRCVGCQNNSTQQKYTNDKQISRQEIIRTHKGCACRRSNCTKKYCDCFQSGLLCRDTCKCIDCQNNESLTNRKVINQLRKNNSQISNKQSVISLYPLYISQNSQHLQSIITQSNPLSLEQNWLQNCAKVLYNQAIQGSEGQVMDKFLTFLIDLQQNINQQLKCKNQSFSQNIQQQQSQLRRQQIGDEQYPIQFQNQNQNQNQHDQNSKQNDNFQNKPKKGDTNQ